MSKGMAWQGFTSLRGIPPHLAPRNIPQSLKLILKPLSPAWFFGNCSTGCIQFNSNELPYFVCYIILPLLHYASFGPRLFQLQLLFAYSMQQWREHLVNLDTCTDVPKCQEMNGELCGAAVQYCCQPRIRTTKISLRLLGCWQNWIVCLSAQLSNQVVVFSVTVPFLHSPTWCLGMIVHTTFFTRPSPFSDNCILWSSW